MPLIHAPSIATNRDRRQAALMSAAAEIARTEGIQAVTVGAVAKRCGIARSTVYTYYASGSDLVADVLVEELMFMAEALADRVAPARNANEAIHCWVRAALEYVTDGRHALVRAASSVDLPPARKQQVAMLHRELSAPLVNALSDIGHTDAARLGQQVSAIIEVCVRRIELGADPDREIAAAEQFLFDGLRSYGA